MNSLKRTTFTLSFSLESVRFVDIKSSRRDILQIFYLQAIFFENLIYFHFGSYIRTDNLRTQKSSSSYMLYHKCQIDLMISNWINKIKFPRRNIFARFSFLTIRKIEFKFEQLPSCTCYMRHFVRMLSTSFQLQCKKKVSIFLKRKTQKLEGSEIELR